MKNFRPNLKTSLMVIIMLAGIFSLSAQNNTWTRKADLPDPNYQAASFTINNMVYVVGGVISHTPTVVLSHKVWQYNPTADVWTRMNDFPGIPVFGASSFVIGNYGYVVNGWDSTNSGSGPATTWQYDPSTDTWDTLAPFPGSTRYTCAAFALNGKGYVTVGFKPYVNDTWELDPVANTWTQKASFPGTPRQSTTWFSIGDYGYVGMGLPESTGWAYFASDFYKYDPVADAWTQLNNFPGQPMISEGTFVMNGLAYMVCNENENQYNLSTQASRDIWQYDPTIDNWSYWGVFPDTGIVGGNHVSCNGSGYFGQGEHFVFGTYSRVWWTFGQPSGPYSCSATIRDFMINDATYNFQAAGTFSPSAILTWNFGDGNTGTGTSVIHSYSAVGSYGVTLTVTDTAGGGCTDSADLNLVVSNISNCSVTVGSAHIGPQFTLYANVSGDGPYTYTWTSPQDPGFLSNAPDPSVNILANDSQIFCVTITDTTGCSAYACTNVVNTPSTDSCQTSIYIFPDAYIPGLYYAYVYHTGGAPVSWSWTFGDGGTSLDSFPAYIYGTPGYYDICLTIVDANGCTSSFCDSFFYAFKTGGGEIQELDVLRMLPAGILPVSTTNVSIYPNPASTELLISSAGRKIDQAVIYDIDGQIINSYSQPAANKIDISSLADGIYFMEITVMGQTTRLKFAKVN